MKKLNPTIEYYNRKAAAFSADTQTVEFSAIQNGFVSRLPVGGRVLDLGCGAGRDSKRFAELGFQVTAVDASEAMCEMTAKFAGVHVLCTTFEGFESDSAFDGIWACASLLHVEKKALPSILRKYVGMLNAGGIFYLSFKYGSFEGIRNERYFTDMTSEALQQILLQIPGIEIIDESVTGDVRPNRAQEKWLNVLVRKI
ncbi:MAG TPA: SAM-dependent methyltransferase [Sutterella sp.]|nr:SAM-dependent methyltransferase [Sutterella sp.]